MLFLPAHAETPSLNETWGFRVGNDDVAGTALAALLRVDSPDYGTRNVDERIESLVTVSVLRTIVFPTNVVG